MKMMKKILLRVSEVLFFLMMMITINAMEEQKKNLLRKEDISDERLRERWQGSEKGLSKKIAENRHVDGTIEVIKKEKLIAFYDIKTKEVTTYFSEGQLVVSYEEFKKKLENNDDEYNIGTLRGDQYIPIENGRRPGQRDSDDAKLGLYFSLAACVGKTRQGDAQNLIDPDKSATREHVQDSEDYELLKKRKRCCCILN